MSDELNIASEPAHRIIVDGPIDFLTAPQLAAALPLTGSVWLDFSGVTFLDPAGVAFLIAAWKAARERDDGFLISGLQGHPRDVTKMTGLEPSDGLAEVRVLRSYSVDSASQPRMISF